MRFFNNTVIKKNWSEAIAFCPAQYLFPQDVDELVRVVRDAHAKHRCIRVIGSGHSFSPVAHCDDLLLSLDNLQGIINVDKISKQVTFWAGTKLSSIGPLLKEHGLALPNMGDIDQQSLAGALQTGTHGTGITLGCLSSFVTEFTLLMPDGEQLTCNSNQDAEIFSFARLALGMLGIIVTVTLQCRNAYFLEDRRWSEPLERGLLESEICAAQSRHFEFFWFPYTNKISAKALNIVEKAKPRNAAIAFVNDQLIENTIYRGMCSLGFRYDWLAKPINQAAALCLPGAYYSDESFKVFPSTRNVKFSEMEFSVAKEHGPACFYDIKRLIEKERLRIFFPIEYRYVAADDIPLSPFFARDSVTISLHTYRGLDQKNYFDAAQKIFSKYEGRPHWGKIHSLTCADLRHLYDGYSRFNKCRTKIDPKGTFVTPYLATLFSAKV